MNSTRRAATVRAIEGHIPGVVWWIVFFGAAITTSYTYLFSFENFGMHIVMTATMAATLTRRSADHCSRLPFPCNFEIGVTPDRSS